jgi:Ni/Co efflux regulator RcnB
MKNECMIIILISVLAITLMSNAMFNGLPPASAQDSENKQDVKAQDSENKQDVKAQDSENKQDVKAQVNTERQQINKCVKTTPEKDMQCNNVIVYGVVCMPGSVCKLERFNVPYELVTPY